MKLSINEWKEIGRVAGWIKKSSCGLHCENCQSCPEDTGLKMGSDGKLRTCCCEGTVTNKAGIEVNQNLLRTMCQEFNIDVNTPLA